MKEETTNTVQTATAAETGAAVAPVEASLKKGASAKKSAPRSQKKANGAKPAGKKATAKKAGKKAPKKAAAARETKRDQVIAMLQRKGGATLEEIMRATGWQKHTTRGFISILSSKHGMKITSSRRESDGARVYEA